MLLIFLSDGDDSLEFISYCFIVLLILPYILSHGVRLVTCQVPRGTYIDYRHNTSYPGNGRPQGWERISYRIDDIQENFRAIVNSLGQRLRSVAAINEVYKDASSCQ